MFIEKIIAIPPTSFLSLPAWIHVLPEELEFLLHPLTGLIEDVPHSERGRLPHHGIEAGAGIADQVDDLI